MLKGGTYLDVSKLSKALETSGGTSVARINDSSWSACQLTMSDVCVQLLSCASKYEH